MYPIILWLLPSLVLGFMGRHRALGFAGFFLASLVFSPVLVLLLLLFTRPVRPDVRPGVPAAAARAKGSS